MSFIKELQRRNVIRAVLTYAVAGWLLVEVMDLLTGAFDAPTWVLKVFIGAISLGILPVFVISWVYEFTPEGIKKEATDHPEHSPGTSRKLDIAVLVMLAVVIGIFVVDKFSSDEPVDTKPAKVAVRKGPPMLAVLPFSTTGRGADSGFFAKGVHDDLLTQLAQLQSIRVISRTSVLEYQDTVRNIREIGKALGADAILEGGVQSSGDNIRINAQLIDAHTDEHLWAHTYDRELTAANIFDVQADIARAITSAMKATLTEDDVTKLAVIPTENMAAYRAYRQAMDIRDTVYGRDYMEKFRRALEEAVALDPKFVRAWAELAGVLALSTFNREGPDTLETIERVEEVLERIRSIAPNSASYLIAQAYYTYYTMKDYDRAYQLVTQAQDLRPSDVRILELKSWIQRRQGDYPGRIESIRLARTLDPRNAHWTDILVNNLIVTHRYDEASQEIRDSQFQNYGLLYGQSFLRLREHRDINRWAEDVAALEKEYGDEAWPERLWEALITNRDYVAAEEEMNAICDADGSDENSRPGISGCQVAQITTYWLLQKNDQLAEVLAKARTHLDQQRDSDGKFRPVSMSLWLDLALVTAAEGNSAEAARLVRRWLREVTADPAERSSRRQNACTILGMAGATNAAVECIRTALVEPSYAMPFFEPYLPYYDPIREEPAFVDLVSELEDGY